MRYSIASIVLAAALSLAGSVPAAAKDQAAKRQELTERYSETFANPYVAAAKGYVDAVIYPHETRAYLLRGLAATEGKRVNRPKRKHGNIPL